MEKNEKIKVGDLVIFKKTEELCDVASYIPLYNQIFVVLEIKPPHFVKTMGDALTCVQINCSEFLEKRYFLYEKEVQKVI